MDRNEDNQLSVKEDVFELELSVKKDLFYKPTIQKFNPLKIPCTLEKNLSFKSRLKYLAKLKKNINNQKAVVLEPGLGEKGKSPDMRQLLNSRKE